MLKVKTHPIKESVSTDVWRRKELGPLSWGRNEFESWFGVNLPQVHWPSSWARRFDFFDRHIIQEGFYGILHHHS